MSQAADPSCGWCDRGFVRVWRSRFSFGMTSKDKTTTRTSLRLAQGILQGDAAAGRLDHRVSMDPPRYPGFRDQVRAKRMVNCLRLAPAADFSRRLSARLAKEAAAPSEYGLAKGSATRGPRKALWWAVGDSNSGPAD